MPRALQPLLPVLAAVTLFGACHTWRASSSPVAETLAGRPDEVRVHRHDGSQITLLHPRLSGDTLLGDREASSTTATVAVALNEIQSVEVRRFAALGTAGLIAGVGATALLIAAA
ncbi:MAG TPA: hypothetical protein VFV66_10310, partial [Nonomuraea sp.]|nr:hypothetical protein [Nonomuraea sp.]